jgi:hypothetical protein
MKPDELDRVLLRKSEIIPSSGFVRSVMAAVRSEAAAPPPIPFPWKRALPGLLVCVIAIAWSVVDVFRSPARPSASVISQTATNWIDAVAPLLDKAQMFGAQWILLGLLLTFAGLKLTWRLAGRRV